MKRTDLIFRLTAAVLLVAGAAAGCGGGARGAQDAEKKSAEKSFFAPPVVPAVITDPGAQASYFVEHFWERFDFRDTTLLAFDLFEPAFSAYAVAVPFAEADLWRRSLARMLDSAACAGPDVLAVFADRAEEYFGSRELPTRFEDAYILLLEKLLAAPEADSLLKIRYRSELHLARKNRPGLPAADFAFATASAKTRRLSQVRAEYTLLMFYDPDCGGCADAVRWMGEAPAFRAFAASGRLKTVAVYTGGDVAAWRRHLSEMPAGWIVGYDRGERIAAEELYDISGIPVFYLLDADKRVVLKEPTAEQIEAQFSQLLATEQPAS